jgi:hypothetical protein
VEDHKKDQTQRMPTLPLTGFTTASREAVMCAIIFAMKEMDSLWVQGLDPFVQWEGGEFDIEKKNTGRGKRHHEGPRAHSKGYWFPVLVDILNLAALPPKYWP